MKNEANHFEETIRSVLSQSLLPTEWIVVDDNSSDTTGEIISKYEYEYSWIRQYKFMSDGLTTYSARVVSVFLYGLNKIIGDYDYIVKLDGDVAFERDFFSSIFEILENDHTLGIVSGRLIQDGVLEKDDIIFGDTRGAVKIYRAKCFRDIGGVIPEVSWDTIDNAAARAKGWKTRQLPVSFVHLKKEGIRVGSVSFLRYRTGISNGNIPYYFPYFFVKILVKLFKKPLLLGSTLELFGYLYSRFVLKKRPFPDFATSQVRKEQRQFLIYSLKNLFVR